ncbi:MAG: hypothetical protein ACRDVM_09830, partial [Acidimicrobiia bacterium]
MLQARSGIRAGRPWADVDLWELWLSLPAEMDFPGAQRQGPARDVLRGRVPDVDRREKTVFNESLLDQLDRQSLQCWLSHP